MNLKKFADGEIDPISLAREAIQFCGLDQIAVEIYLFGSASNGQMGPHSDIDLLVVFNRLEELKQAQRNILEKPFLKWPIDWVLKVKADFDERSEVGGVCFIAKHQGNRLL